MKIYIAGPFSTERERESLKHMIELVKSRYPGYSLYIPMSIKFLAIFKNLMEHGIYLMMNGQEKYMKMILKILILRI